MDKAQVFEGQDIINLMQALLGGNEEEYEKIVDDELTKGRIRTIYTQLKYGSKRAQDIAEYYDIPITLVKDIGKGKIFEKITKDLIE